MQKKHIVVLADGFMNWSGGIDFFTTNVLALLSFYNPAKYKITLIFPEKKFFLGFPRLLLRFPLLVRWICWRRVQKNAWLKAFKKEGACLTFARFGRRRINRKLKQLKADLAFFSWSDLEIECPNIGFYPDLQHKFYPQFFSKEECENRDRTIQNILSKRDYIVVLSQNVKNHLERFYKTNSAKIVSLPFSPIILDKGWLDPLPYDIKKKYGIRNPYFMISNQFWVHKEHKTAFDALYELIEQGEEIDLVCTGKADDFRSPNHYHKLLDHLQKLRLEKRVHLLGLIPKRDQVELMKGSRGVLQPTLFEGGPGGGSIQNAVALGVPTISSDIPVNLEICGNGVEFFKVQDSHDLFLKMDNLLKKKFQRPSKETLIKEREAHLKRLGTTLLKPIETLLSK